MDMIRSGYRCQMKTIQGGPAVDVLWYKTPEGAEVYGDRSAFRSRNWCDPHDNDDIGEQYNPDLCCGTEGDRWYSGRMPEGASVGPVPCGTSTVAYTGAGPGDPTFMTNEDGSADCCESVPDCPPLTFPIAGYALVEWFPGTHAFGVLNPIVPIWRLFTGSGTFVDIFCGVGFIRLEINTPFMAFVFPDEWEAGYALFTIPSMPPFAPLWWGKTIELFWPDPP